MNTASLPPAPPILTPMEEYLFDLRGYLVLKKAVDRPHLAALNATLDEMLHLQPPLTRGEWYGCVHAHSFGGKDGTNLQQIYEADEAFERMIDHPSWIEKVKHFVGGQTSFDATHGPVFIDENFANVRGPGEAIGLHSGGERPVKRCQFRYRNGEFSCGQINILTALNDIGPGDGATMVIPGSHKANFVHPGGVGADHAKRHSRALKKLFLWPLLLPSRDTRLTPNPPSLWASPGS